MIKIRKSADRGHFDHGWLDTRHTFSFADYFDPAHMGYRTLRVINEDRVGPGEGFPTHGHQDMEIVTYILDGELEHKDSMGNTSVIRPGEVQRMSAGTGVRHSEFNASKAKPVHLLQIWIHPSTKGIKPGYEQKAYPPQGRLNRERLVASPDGREGSVRLHQDALVFDATIEPGKTVEHLLPKGRGAWVQVVRGLVELDGKALEAGDGAAVEGEPVRLTGREKSDVLLFDLA